VRRPGRRTVAAALAALALAPRAALAAAVGAGELYALPLRWTDDGGRPVRLADWRGRPVVISMAYGACRRVCSVTLRRMEQLQALADRRGVALEFVVISLDPQADTPGDWQAVRAEHHLRRDNWHFLAGSDVATRQVAAILGIGFWRYDDHVVHDFRVALLDADGAVARVLKWADDDVGRLLPDGGMAAAP